MLHWYDQCSQKQFAYRINENEIATAIVDYAPDRAVVIWKNKAERMIAQVKPSAYQEAGNYLRKASVIMARENKQKQWDQYLQALRQEHIRKIRLIEILDGLDGKPIVKQKRKNK